MRSGFPSEELRLSLWVPFLMFVGHLVRVTCYHVAFECSAHCPRHTPHVLPTLERDEFKIPLQVTLGAC